ncbi:Integrator complex subunit 3 [Linum grandiflorum]
MLLNIASHEATNEFESSLRQAFEELELKLRPPFSIAILTPHQYSQLNHAILYGVLTEPQFAKIHIKHLHGIVSDGYASFVDLVLKVVELYSRLVDSVKAQLIWVVKEMVDVLGVGVDGLLVGLLREIIGGDYSERSLWFCSELINLFLDKFDFLLEEEPLVMTSALYVYLRLLADQCRVSGNKILDLLKRLEIDFCIKMLRQHFQLSMKIGRDLVRLLQDLVHVPEFRNVWKDLVLDPTQFRTEGFSDISQLYGCRTSSRYFLLRISPDMEKQLRFLLVRVKFGHQKRYQSWFAKKFILGPDRETIVVDIIRFICCAHHPSNEILQSEVIPRWAVIGWLLSSCRKKYVEANAKLALFYDWLFFDERGDNVMNIEPAMLLMVYSMPQYISMTRSLLEFLLLLVDNYDQERIYIVAKGVSSAFSSLVKKGVVRSMDVLTSCDALPPFLTERLKKLLSRVNEVGPYQLHPCRLPNYSAVALNPTHGTHLDTSIASLEHEPASVLEPRCSKIGTDSEPVNSSCSSFPVSNMQTTSALETPTPSPKHQPSHTVLETLSASSVQNTFVSAESFTNTIQTQTDETPASDPTVPIVIASPLVAAAESQSDPDPTENLLQQWIDDIKNSSGSCTQIFEAILLSLGNGEEETPGSGSVSPENLCTRLDDALQADDYSFFYPLDVDAAIPCDGNDIKSLTTLTVRSYILFRHVKLQRMLMFWSRNGAPVGAHILLYASRLAYDADIAGYSENGLIDEESHPGTSLLNFHLNGHFSVLDCRKQSSSQVSLSPSKPDRKFIEELVRKAFAAYKCFLVYSNDLLLENEKVYLSKLLFSDIVTCLNWERKRGKSLFSHIFYHLADICVCAVDIARLLVSQLDHVDLVNVQYKIGLKKISMFGKDVAAIVNLIKLSLTWDHLEQHKLWGLIRSELAVSDVQVANIILGFSFCSELDLDSAAVAVGGLLALCGSLAPTPELVGAIMLLPNSVFAEFSAVALSTWAASSTSMLIDSLTMFLERSENKNKNEIGSARTEFNHSAILWVLKYFSARGIDASSAFSI